MWQEAEITDAKPSCEWRNPPSFSISALSPTKRLTPSPHLSISLSSCFLFALLVCLFIFITSLSFYLPPLSPSPSLVVFLLTFCRGFPGSSFFFLAVGEADVVGSWRSHRCTTLGFCRVERRHIEFFFCGLICAYLSELIYPPHVTLDFKCKVWIQNSCEPVWVKAKCLLELNLY